MRLIVDASVGVKWFFREPGSDAAVAVLQGPAELLAPELFVAEVVSAVLKKMRLGEASADEAEMTVRWFTRLPVRPVGLEGRADRVFEIARTAGVSACDGTYVAVAELCDCPVITADAKLVQLVAGTPWEERVVALGDLAAS